MQVLLKDVYRSKDRVYVRYAIENDGQMPYQTGTPAVFTLQSPHSSRSLYSLSARQLSTDRLHIDAEGQTRMNPIEAQGPVSGYSAGGTVLALIAFELSSTRESGPTVLRFAFPADAAGEVIAYLVL